MTQKQKDRWDNVTIRVKAPEGTAFIEILENSPGNIHQVIMRVGKAGSAVNAHCWVIAEMATKLFQKGTGINEMIMLLDNVTSDRPSIKTESGVEVRSIPEALAVALRRYRTTIPPVETGDSRIARFRGR